jgi:hypothetical protein
MDFYAFLEENEDEQEHPKTRVKKRWWPSLCKLFNDVHPTVESLSK